MSNKEIKKQAFTRLNSRIGSALALTMFKAAFLLAFLLTEILLYEILKLVGVEYNFTPAYIFGTHLGRFMIIVRLILFIFLYVPENYVLRRLMVDLYLGRNFIDTRRFFQYNVRRLNNNVIFGALLPKLLKLFVLIPIGIGVYGIYYWGWLHSGDKLTTFGLFVFMLSIGFTIVWTGVYIHYSISLKLTKYILALNPRTNVFDACDLSVRLMEGQHSRYIGFVLSFVKYLPLLVFVYPILAIEPIYRMSEMALAQDIMGNYWQDKYPAMIHRWSKYADRDNNLE